MKKITFFLVLMSFFLINACDKEKEVNQTESNIEKETIGDNELIMENIELFAIQQYIDEENRIIYNLFFIIKDGSIYTMNYVTNVGGSDDNSFIKKFFNFDNNIWGLVNGIKKVGKLSDAENGLLKECLPKVNKDSGYFKADKEKIPDVEEVVYYKIYCCIGENDRSKDTFCIAKNGKLIGKLYETYDKDALKLLEMLENNVIYSEWSNVYLNTVH